MTDFELAYESQAGAEQLLTELGALDQLRAAVIQHCEETAPLPPYEPQRIKALMKPAGWVPEVRVKPLQPDHDDLPVNDRFDLWKDFERDGEYVGVGLEIEKWAVWNDLLKFHRAFARNQICAGIILHENPQGLDYVFNHLRLMAEPLFAEIPILFAAPRGGELLEPYERTRKYRPYRMPGDGR